MMNEDKLNEAYKSIILERSSGYYDIEFDKFIDVYNSGKLKDMIIDITAGDYNENNDCISRDCNYNIYYEVFSDLFEEDDTNVQEVQEDEDENKIKFRFVSGEQQDSTMYSDDDEAIPFWVNFDVTVDMNKYNKFFKA